MPTCPDCNKPIDSQAVFCENCGLKLKPNSQQPPEGFAAFPTADLSSAPIGTCSACGYANTPGETFCMNCGVQLAPVSSTPPPPPKPYSSTPQASPLIEEGTPPAALGRDTSPIVCHDCEYVNDPGEQFCQNCGLQLNSQDAAPPGQQHAHSSGVDSSKPALDQLPESPAVQSSDTCPGCGQQIDPTAIFCQTCGLQLITDSESSPSYETYPIQVDATTRGLNPSESEYPTLPGRLLLKDTGREIRFPAGKTQIIIGRSDPNQRKFPDIDLTTYGGDRYGVSRQHIRLVSRSGRVFVEDLRSTNFTFLNKDKLPPGELHELSDGDELRLGGLVLTYDASS
jgi:pSer/pThr/pTyr-binding forkhead associated (FHA) protein